MKDEVTVAVRFLSRLVEKHSSVSGIDAEQLEAFRNNLTDLLLSRFKDHWFPEKPSKGQGYRCIRLNEIDKKEKSIAQAAAASGLSYEQLRLPPELTIWVDPKEVACRFGEHQGSFCTLASFKNGTGEIFLDQVNLDEINKKNIELKEKVTAEMNTRKNGRRGFLAPSPGGFKGGRSYSNNGFNGGPHGGHGHLQHTPSPAAVSWYNSVNNSSSMDNMFSTSPPSQYMFPLAKFSPPKYGYEMRSSKWSSPQPHFPPPATSKGDKYHWFNSSNKSTIKA